MFGNIIFWPPDLLWDGWDALLIRKKDKHDTLILMKPDAITSSVHKPRVNVRLIIYQLLRYITLKESLYHVKLNILQKIVYLLIVQMN